MLLLLLLLLVLGKVIELIPLVCGSHGCNIAAKSVIILATAGPFILPSPLSLLLLLLLLLFLSFSLAVVEEERSSLEGGTRSLRTLGKSVCSISR